jgi:hypothetical protein
MKRGYQGSCHCSAVRFECEIDLAQGTSKCNCSICAKTRFRKAIVKADAFRLRQGKEALSDYQFGISSIHHLFCSHCGIKPFGRGHLDELGGEFYAVVWTTSPARSWRTHLSATKTVATTTTGNLHLPKPVTFDGSDFKR